jgi:aldehyde:ferredoxin oxidoreductase
MVLPGALSGSRSPYSGRTSVGSFSPQGYPVPWFTRSNIGGRFGAELKRAGYDGVVVTGAAEYPVRISIHDDQVRILPADDLWGLDALDTLEALASVEGTSTYSLAIGPAGEHLSHIATIQTDSSSACGQGGFGAVMGAKHLKAISVAGSDQVLVTRPETLAALARELARRAKPPRWFGPDMAAFNRRLAAEGDGQARLRGCSAMCVTPCAVEFRDMPGCVYDRSWSGDWVCIALRFPGPDPTGPNGERGLVEWHLDRRAAFEMNVLSNRYGLNQFDILTGIVPWLISCQAAGLVSELDGRPIDWNSPEFWAHFLRALAHREGAMADALADGGWTAARTLRLGGDLGQELAAQFYPGWGHASHWDGRDGWNQPFPYWIPAVLQWMSDTRDPFSTGHGSLHGMTPGRRVWEAQSDEERTAALADVRAFGDRIYGTPEAFDPTSGYEGKAEVGYFHTLRPVIKDCVPVDDQTFPLLWEEDAPDHVWRFHDVPGIGEIEGPSVEYHLFRAGTGVEWDEAEFERAVARVLTLERALQVRHWGRDRQVDELALAYFEQPESFPNPLVGKPQALDREQFRPVADAFYTLHGWDPATGQPTRERLEELGLAAVYGPMASKAHQDERQK